MGRVSLETVQTHTSPLSSPLSSLGLSLIERRGKESEKVYSQRVLQAGAEVESFIFRRRFGVRVSSAPQALSVTTTP